MNFPSYKYMDKQWSSKIVFFILDGPLRSLLTLARVGTKPHPTIIFNDFIVRISTECDLMGTLLS